MRNITISLSPMLTLTLETDDQQVISALYHRLNVGSRRLLHARSIVDGEPVGPTYAEQYGVSKEDVLAKDSPLADIADALEPYVNG